MEILTPTPDTSRANAMKSGVGRNSDRSPPALAVSSGLLPTSTPPISPGMVACCHPRSPAACYAHCLHWPQHLAWRVVRRFLLA